MKKEEKLSAWVAIVNHGKEPPLFEKLADADDLNLLEAQSDVVEMAHTALGHLEALKKLTMTQEDFEKLAVDGNELIVESSGMITPTLMVQFLTVSWLSRCPIFSPPTNQLTRPGMMEELWGKKVGFSSVNSNKIMMNHVLVCSP